MSEPSYRINTERLWSNVNPWEARLTRLTDGEHMFSAYGDTEAWVIEECQKWVKQYHGTDDGANPGGVLFVSEDGSITEGAAA